MAAASGKDYVGEMACTNAHCESHDMNKRVNVTLSDRGTLGTYCHICKKGDYAGIMHVNTRAAWITEMRRNSTFIGDRILRAKIERKRFEPASDPELMLQVLPPEAKAPASKPEEKQGSSWLPNL